MANYVSQTCNNFLSPLYKNKKLKKIKKNKRYICRKRNEGNQILVFYRDLHIGHCSQQLFAMFGSDICDYWSLYMLIDVFLLIKITASRIQIVLYIEGQSKFLIEDEWEGFFLYFVFSSCWRLTWNGAAISHVNHCIHFTTMPNYLSRNSFFFKYCSSVSCDIMW